jgi:CheY-like chemotaxis protein
LSYAGAVKRIDTWPADLVVTAWDRPFGQQIYRWGLKRDLGKRFGFVVDEIVPRLERAAEQRRVARLADHDAVREMVIDLARQRRAAEAAVAKVARPRLLLVEDDPDQRAAMTDVLEAVGYDVVAAGGVHDAMAALEHPGIDGVLSDWRMADGTGAELRNLIASHRPEMLDALVFITGGDIAMPAAAVAPAPVLPKGQDSMTLASVLTRAIRR